MTKKDFKIVVDELRNNVWYADTDVTPLSGCGLPDFPLRKIVRKEVILMHLRWQCVNLDGTIDEEELSNNLQIFKDKKVIMI